MIRVEFDEVINFGKNLKVGSKLYVVGYLEKSVVGKGNGRCEVLRVIKGFFLDLFLGF